MPYGSSAYGRYVYGADAFLPIDVDGGGDTNFATELNAIGGGSGDFASTYSFLINTEGGGSVRHDLTLHLLINTEGGGELNLKYSLGGALVDLACYILNMDTGRTSEFANYEFLGYGRFNQILLGIKATGIYDLETDAVDDDGVDIDASLEILSDFGIPNFKRFRALFAEASGDVRITITDATGKTVAYNITPNEFRSLPRSVRDQAFTIKIENIIGEKITLRRLHGKLNVFERKGE